MFEFGSGDWFDAVSMCGSRLPAIEGLSFDFSFEVTASPAGKVKGYGVVEDGRLVTFESGKGEGTPMVTFEAKAGRLFPVVAGRRDPLVAFMLGEIKIDGAYELVVDELPRRCNTLALEEFRRAVADATSDLG